MRENGLGKNCENVVFGQIYGMGEQISMPLGKLYVMQIFLMALVRMPQMENVTADWG